MKLTEALKRAATYGKWLREGKISKDENEMLVCWLKSQQVD